MKAISRAIQILGGQAATARAVGVSQPSVCKWARGGTVAAEHVLPIYRATGGAVTPHELRPDIYPDPEWRPPLEAPAGSPGPGAEGDAGADQPEKEAA